MVSNLVFRISNFFAAGKVMRILFIGDIVGKAGRQAIEGVFDVPVNQDLTRNSASIPVEGQSDIVVKDPATEK
jgi:hypothetical protein